MLLRVHRLFRVCVTGGVGSAARVSVKLSPSEAARVFRFGGFVTLSLCVVGGVRYMGDGEYRTKLGRA